MTPTTHVYRVDVRWTPEPGQHTTTRRRHTRDTELSAGAKPPILGSADPAFLGDAARWNPEDLLVASLSQCHLLWYLDLASRAGIEVTRYVDEPVGTMIENIDGAGQFADVTLRPTVTITRASATSTALELHADAHANCFIARSVNFPVRHEPTVRVEPADVSTQPRRSTP